MCRLGSVVEYKHAGIVHPTRELVVMSANTFEEDRRV